MLESNDSGSGAYYLLPYGISGGRYVSVAVVCSDSTDPCDSSYSVLSSDFVLAFKGSSATYAEFAPVPTPEPGTLSLTMVGAGLLGLMRARRRRKAHAI